jgi:predicted nucleic acid-binding protein
MTLVADASVVVAALIDKGPDGQWALQVLSATDHQPITAPHLLHFEVANTVRRMEAAGRIGPETALLAHTDLLSMPVELAGYTPFADRAWELRASVTVYDASYVALAEALGVPLATLDGRLVRSNGPRCDFLVPS